MVVAMAVTAGALSAERLPVLVESESLLNDGTAIVFFTMAVALCALHDELAPRSGEEPEARDEHLTRMLTIILLVVLLMALGGGGWGHSRYGAAGWSPAGIIILVIVVLWFTGNLHFA